MLGGAVRLLSLAGAAQIAAALVIGQEPEAKGPEAKVAHDPCKTPHPEDLEKPIPQVLAENPGVNGKCHFNAHYPNWSTERLPDVKSYWESFIGTLKQFSDPEKLGKGPLVKYHLPDETILTSHNDGVWGSYAYDDVMCYQMGWLKGQIRNLSWMYDVKQWEEFSSNECERLRMEENLTAQEMTVQDLIDKDSFIATGSECFKDKPGKCTPVTRKEYVRHVYVKCLLGGEATFAEQVQWCHARACVNRNNQIMHGSDCWPAYEAVANGTKLFEDMSKVGPEEALKLGQMSLANWAQDGTAEKMLRQGQAAFQDAVEKGKAAMETFANGGGAEEAMKQGQAAIKDVLEKGRAAVETWVKDGHAEEALNQGKAAVETLVKEGQEALHDVVETVQGQVDDWVKDKVGEEGLKKGKAAVTSIVKGGRKAFRSWVKRGGPKDAMQKGQAAIERIAKGAGHAGKVLQEHPEAIQGVVKGGKALLKGGRRMLKGLLKR